MSGKTLNLPTIVPFPPPSVREIIGENEWVTYCDSWKSTILHYISLEDFEFSTLVLSLPSLPEFLTTYIEAAVTINSSGTNHARLASERMSSDVFILIRRTLLEAKNPPKRLMTCEFLGKFAIVYRRTLETSPVILKAWNSAHSLLECSVKAQKESIIKMLGSTESSLSQNINIPHHLLHFLRSCAPAAEIFVIGSDFIDSIASSYGKWPLKTQSSLTILLYLGFIGLLDGGTPRFSLLFDHLFTLKIDAEAKKSMNPPEVSILSSLVSNTPLLTKLQSKYTNTNVSRAFSLLSTLTSFNDSNSWLRRKTHNMGTNVEGKENVVSNLTLNETHLYRANSISQVQDLFPTLGRAFIEKLVGYFKGDVEQVTAHLLENDIPKALQDMAQLEDLAISKTTMSADATLDPLPRVTPPTSLWQEQFPQRRNVYDDDEFDRLAIPASQIRMGLKKDFGSSNKTFFSPEMDEQSKTSHKTAILSALAAFDADDDERDDTYDLDDVGGTVDASKSDADTAVKTRNQLEVDGFLYDWWRSNPNMFERTAATRRGETRNRLREATGMSDEGIEGWAIMLAKSPHRLRKLEERFVDQSGLDQPSLSSTRWAGYAQAQSEEYEDDSDVKQRKGGARKRTLGALSPKTGNNTESREIAPELRQRKAAPKHSWSNHNRRKHRAQKIARAGYEG